MKVTEQDKIKLLTFFALCQNLINFIDGDWNGHPANRQAVKSNTKTLLRELEKTIKVLFPDNLNESREDAMDVIDTFLNAVSSMEHFFMLRNEYG